MRAIVVLGGGPAGCAVAIAARRLGLGPVFVVESGAYDAERVGESIPPDTRSLLRRLGVLEAFEAEGHEPCAGSCSSWGDDALGFNDFVFNPHGTGFHLDRRRFDLFMARQAIEAGARVLTRTRYRSARARPGGFEITLETDGCTRRIAAPYVVDATGPGAAFARNRGAVRRLHDHMFCGMAYFHLREGASFRELTMLEAVRDGWWYAARLPHRRVAVAFACDGPTVKQGRLHLERPWLEALAQTRHVSAALSESFLLPGTLRVCPVPCFVLDQAAGARWLAVGDAATAFDPLSARGVYKAISMGLEAADTIAATLGGDEAAAGRYTAAVHRLFAGYVEQRDAFYEQEQRWAGAPFWVNRRNRVA